ncbi:MAG TPA: hypothetical protein VLH15_07485 [Dehalococcoidales bacterium]|nr:hypothetical protein [Dehalococcoidales bacterium]
MNNFEKYLVRNPQQEICAGTDNSKSETLVFLSRQQVPEANYYLALNWIRGMPANRGSVPEHVHDHDEIMLFWGSDPEHPQTLGGEIEYSLAGQKILFNTTTGIFIPGGVPHGPAKWMKYFRPHVQMLLKLGTGENLAGRPPDLSREIPGSAQLKNRGSDYEQYVIRSPMREAGAEFLRGRTAPTMTYMSGLQVPAVKCYIEFGWTFDMPLSQRAGTGMPEMLHRNFDEIVLHVGGDPDKPAELGGEIELFVGGQPLRFNTSNALFIPKGLLHGPLACLKYEKPHIVMAIMIGIGSLREGWNDIVTDSTAQKKGGLSG